MSNPKHQLFTAVVRAGLAGEGAETIILQCFLLQKDLNLQQGAK